MTAFLLVDNSVTRRTSRSDLVRVALRERLAEGQLACCLTQLLEEGFSARDPAAHATIVRLNQTGKVILAPVPEMVEIAVELQRRLFAAGKGRAVGVSDLQLAATALHYSDDEQSVEIVHYDSDFDHFAAIEPRLRTRWIVPRGTVP